ncbi:MAG: SPOR domain-containing protein [Dysgonamonadaceae bacterium]|nr:SPOR domain-containing protein [Dysgonamonadaceae bacterium]
MNNLNFHIAYLLSKHECIIIPGFGALIVSGNGKNRADKRNVLLPPERFLSFNSEITHNDGLLANSVAKEKNIGYREALDYINDFAEDLWNRLNQGERIQIPWVGRFSFASENRIIFNSAPNMSCNANFYGFTGVRLPRLIELDELSEMSYFKLKRKRDVDTIWIPINRKIAMYAASTAAAILAMLFIPSSLNNYSQQAEIRSASFLSFPSKPQTEVIQEVIRTEETVEIPAPAVEISIQPKQSENISDKNYFIVISSLSTRQIAEDELKRYINKGFNKAFVHSSNNKHRIVVAAFSDKQEAKIYLRQFREDNPMYEKAWLLY